MKLSADRLDETSLGAYCGEVVDLLAEGDIPAVAERFGYALAFGRDPAIAIKSDLSSALASLGATRLVPAMAQTPRVGHFKRNDTGLVAIVEALVPTDSGKPILVELVVSGSGVEVHLTLEQISAAA